MSDGEHEFEIPSDATFWNLLSLGTSNWKAFQAQLAKLRPETLVGFASMFWGLASVFWQWAQDETGCSEDAAEDIGGRLVARGREFYVAAIQQPETLLTAEFLDSLEGAGMEMMYEAEKLYLASTGTEFVAACDGPYFDIDDSEYGALVAEELRS
ncbi:MAG: DUF4240 domain-containing protein [Polyangiaceae bacterium]|nr:DUF4240 domain-containing protein [Polyangiaceae bacterium]